jgi:hypothetical protein
MGNGAVNVPEPPERRGGDRWAEQNQTVRAWMIAYLAAIRPAPNQLPDTRLGDHIGLLKSRRTMRFFGKTARLERQPHGTIISAVIDCAGASPQVLKRAFRRAARRAVDQQMDKAQRQAGVLLDAEVAEDGRVGLRAVITDAAAAAKALHAVYSGLVVDLDGDEVEQISLVDNPIEFAKASGGAQVIAKIFTRKGVSKVEPVPVYTKKYLRLMQQQAVQEVLRKAATPALPPAMEAALQERQRAEDMFKTSPSPATRAAFGRAHDRVVLEQIKYGRPIAGDPRFSLGR